MYPADAVLANVDSAFLLSPHEDAMETVVPYGPQVVLLDIAEKVVIEVQATHHVAIGIDRHHVPADVAFLVGNGAAHEILNVQHVDVTGGNTDSQRGQGFRNAEHLSFQEQGFLLV
jgi:hypothetical protein